MICLQKDGSETNLNVNPAIPTQTGACSHMRQSFIVCPCIRKLCAAKEAKRLCTPLLHTHSTHEQVNPLASRSGETAASLL